MRLELSFSTAIKLLHDGGGWAIDLSGSSEGSGNFRLEVSAVAQILQSTDTDSRIAQLDEIDQDDRYVTVIWIHPQSGKYASVFRDQQRHASSQYRRPIQSSNGSYLERSILLSSPGR